MLTVEDLLVKMVSFPSLSGQEKELVDWLENYVRETGLLELERHGDNLLMHLGNGNPWLLLNSHSDVVPPSPDHYKEPFRPFKTNGKVYGRGTTDAKGCGSSMITALLQLASEGFKPKGRVSFAITVCEEGIGINNGMATLRNIIPNPDAAIVGEPTSLQPCIAQKGLLILKVETKGDSGHAARVDGNNAIYNMGKVLVQLEKCHIDTPNDFIGKTKITPTQINGGTAKNMAPEATDIVLDIRTIPEVPNEQILDLLNSKLDAEISIISDRYLAASTSPDSKIAQSAKKASGRPFVGSPTASDWAFLHEIPTVKIGPGHSPQSHTKDEYIEVQQLYDGVELYKNIIKNYFSE